MKLPVWFRNRLKTVMAHNNYGTDWFDVNTCDEYFKWTPCSLILREYLNNGGGSSKGFLGISTSECIRCVNFIRENREELIKMNYINIDGWNNSGFMLWTNYKF